MNVTITHALTINPPAQLLETGITLAIQPGITPAIDTRVSHRNSRPKTLRRNRTVLY